MGFDDEHAVAGATKHASIGCPRRVTNYDHLREGPIFANIARKPTDISLSQYDWTVQIEGRSDDTVGHSLALSHGFGRILQHVQEELLVWEVLLG